jgi:hypothetical protein
VIRLVPPETVHGIAGVNSDQTTHAL